MNISDILRARVAEYPERAAIIDARHGRTRTLTFAQLEIAAARAAALLHRSGLKPGDGVLLFQPISAELYIALTAIFRLGLVAMFLDPWAGKEHIERCCSLYPPKALTAGFKAHLLRMLSPAIRHIPFKFSIGLRVPGAVDWASAEELAPLEHIQSCTPETPALLTFTSGSTGEPKAAVRSHGFLLAQHRALEKHIKLKVGEIDLSTLPIFVLANLASGVTSLLPDADLARPGSANPASLIAQIKAFRPTRTTASPALLERLTDYCAEHGLTLPEFKKIFVGGAPVFPRLLIELNSTAPDAQLVTVYGSTEAEPIACVTTDQIQAADLASMLNGHGLLAGAPVPEIQLRILPDHWGRAIGPSSRAEFAAACLRPGHPGEIVVSGEHVLPGYLNGRGDSESKFTVEGATWHRTGDAGYIDRQDRLWLLGRCSARIEDIHGTLYPLAVECAAHHQSRVRRAAVVSHKNQRILLVEPRDPGAEIDFSLLKQTLAWAHIERVHSLSHIPVDKRHNAKVDYEALYNVLDRSLGLGH